MQKGKEVMSWIYIAYLSKGSQLQEKKKVKKKILNIMSF